MTDTTLPHIQSRRHKGGTDYAVFSPDAAHAHRYKLVRRWELGPTITWVCLNPSTADAFKDDATAAKIRKFTLRLAPRSGGLRIVNLFALRATDPAELWKHPDPVGPGNDETLRDTAEEAVRNGLPIIAAWGTHGAGHPKRPETIGRGLRVAEMFADAGVRMLCLGTNRDGSPKHPLYLAGNTALEPYTMKAVAHV